MPRGSTGIYNYPNNEAFDENYDRIFRKPVEQEGTGSQASEGPAENDAGVGGGGVQPVPVQQGEAREEDSPRVVAPSHRQLSSGMVGLYRKRPLLIEAIQWTGENFGAVEAFTEYANVHPETDAGALNVVTLEGFKPCPVGYWIVRGIKGEFYPVADTIFRATYEEVVPGKPV